MSPERQVLYCSPPAFSRLRNLLRLVPVLFAMLAAGTAQANTTPALACSPLLNSYQSLWAAADFDGDQSIDLARVTLRRDRNGVVTSEVDLFALCFNELPPMFGAFPQSKLVLSAQDVDADDDQDLVLTEPLAGETLGVWLNDGTGWFSATDPSNFPGAGHDPPILGKRTSRVRDPAVYLSSNGSLFIPQRTALTLFAPGSPRTRREGAIRVASVRGDTRQSRAPPFLSF